MSIAKEPAVLYQIYTPKHKKSHLENLKQVSGLSDKRLSEYLNVSEKSLRTYKNDPAKISLQLKEHLLLLKLLFELGDELFTGKSDFLKWLSTPNFFFDNNAPEYFLTTITGIRYVYDRLIAMQYGDNV